MFSLIPPPINSQIVSSQQWEIYAGKPNSSHERIEEENSADWNPILNDFDYCYSHGNWNESPVHASFHPVKKEKNSNLMVDETNSSESNFEYGKKTQGSWKLFYIQIGL